MKIRKAPAVGWGVLTPDLEISEETLELIKSLRKLPAGQKDALLTRAIGRTLNAEYGLSLEDDEEPDVSQMVECSSLVNNLFMDILA